MAMQELLSQRNSELHHQLKVLHHHIIIYLLGGFQWFLSFSIAAGFSQEWHSNAGERTQRRQVEVQANIDNNPNRPAEYRTVTTAQTETHPEFEAEERTFGRIFFSANMKIEQKYLLFIYRWH